MRIKKIDIFILKSFLLLLAGTFFICLFILLMNILWRYVDVMVGKGLSVGVLAQFFFCSALTLVPMALPLAVLLASLITFGNFGERYELLAMKTAGTSLLRVMKPLIIFCVFLAAVSFYFQNVIGPKASQKMDTLAVSMYEKSPALEIPEGAFYDAITGYNIYVKSKNAKTGGLYDVTIYDVSQGFEKIRVIAADSGMMETTADKQHLYLHLYSGEQFENMEAQSTGRNNNPYRRESFREKHLLIDFDTDFSMVDENRMSAAAASKNMSRIRHDIDSLSRRQDSLGIGNLADFRLSAMVPPLELSEEDSLLLASSDLKVINVDSIFNTASKSKQLEYMNDIQIRVQGQKSDLSFKGASMATGDRTVRKHWIEWMKKISLCLSILIFFFIGAPLGAIIRKGGLGVPVIVSVCTFILYYVTSNSGEKMFREGDWGVIGCWFSTLVLLPLSAFFTYSANKDSTVFEWDVYKEFFRHWFGGKVRRNIVLKDVVIDDPDMKHCVSLNKSILEQCHSLLPEMEGMGCVPGYSALFFGKGDTSRLNKLSDDMEGLVEELANTRDRVIISLLDSFPVLPVYGVEPPFASDKVNVTIGAIFPLGLLFWVRAWLFSLKLRKQIVHTADISQQLDCYVHTGKLKQES